MIASIFFSSRISGSYSTSVKPLIFVVPPLFLVWVWENKKLKELGLSFEVKKFLTDLYIGVVLGIIGHRDGCLILSMLANYLKYRRFSFEPVDAVIIAGGIGSFLLINLATAVSEEILGRGFLYGRLYKATKKQLWSAMIASFLFMLLHFPIMFTRLHLTGSALLFYPLSIFLMGVTNSYLYTLRGNLLLPILLHAFWNMTVAVFL